MKRLPYISLDKTKPFSLKEAIDAGYREAIGDFLVEKFTEALQINSEVAIREAVNAISADADLDTDADANTICNDLTYAVLRVDAIDEPDNGWYYELVECLSDLGFIRAHAPDLLPKIERGELISFHWRAAYKRAQTAARADAKVAIAA